MFESLKDRSGPPSLRALRFRPDSTHSRPEVPAMSPTSETIFEAPIERAGLMSIYRKILDGARLTGDDGLALAACADINLLGYMANVVRERKNGNLCYFVRNQHINYTNICNKDCSFCAFYVRAKDPAGYTLSVEEVRQRVLEQMEEPVTEIHMVAGINPRLPYEYYLDIVRAVKETRPSATVKAFTMIELAEIARVARKPREQVFEELKAAGLGSLPGGGAERIDHLLKLRDLQDETNGFLTFIPLAFHPENTEISHLPPTTGMLDLKQIAIARLMLDNFDHVKSFWIMVTPPVSQLSLWYGADDIDGTILREEITHAAGARTPQALTRNELVAMVREAGREPVERDPLYRVIWREAGA